MSDQIEFDITLTMGEAPKNPQIILEYSFSKSASLVKQVEEEFTKCGIAVEPNVLLIKSPKITDEIIIALNHRFYNKVEMRELDGINYIKSSLKEIVEVPLDATILDELAENESIFRASIESDVDADEIAKHVQQFFDKSKDVKPSTVFGALAKSCKVIIKGKTNAKISEKLFGGLSVIHERIFELSRIVNQMSEYGMRRIKLSLTFAELSSMHSSHKPKIEGTDLNEQFKFIDSIRILPSSTYEFFNRIDCFDASVICSNSSLLSMRLKCPDLKPIITVLSKEFETADDQEKEMRLE